MIEKVVNKAFELAKKRNWDKVYFSVDIHDTMIVPNYQAGNIPTEWYPNAVECLQEFTKRNDIALILYTCSHPHEIEQYIEYFKKHDIKFDYVNSNPEVLTDKQGYGNYEQKFYVNAVLDDKGGFNPKTDWKYILNDLRNNCMDYSPFKTNEHGILHFGNIGIYRSLDNYVIYSTYEELLNKSYINLNNDECYVLYNGKIHDQRHFDAILSGIL